MRAAALFGRTTTTELERITEQVRALSDKLSKADAWFADHGPEHPKWVEAGRRVDQVVKELGEALDRLRALGFQWDGKAAIPLAPTKPPTTPPTPTTPPEPWSGVEVTDLSHMGPDD